MKKDERLQALRILTSLLKDKISLSAQFPQKEALSPMTKALCFGFCRHYYRLEAMALLLLDKRPKELELWVVILMGLYQLHYMHEPDYAVVKETVALVDKIKKSWAKALVNAILRRFCRQKEALLAELNQNESFLYAHPAWLLDELKEKWPLDWQAIVAANDEHPPMTLRVNAQKVPMNQYLEQLDAKRISYSINPVIPQSITLEDAKEVQDLPAFKEGWVSVQDGAAQLAAMLLDLKPGLRLLDACCAPGGKTCHILETEPNLSCVALDVDLKRLERVKENLGRLGLNAQILQGDVLKPETWWDGKPFDRILLDAPCSATGVIRRHPDIKLLRSKEECEAITLIQRAMLEVLWPMLAPGGLMLYATCSVMPCENEEQIAHFISLNQDCEAILGDKAWGRSTGHGRQILPNELGMDGFFYSLLRKKD